MICVCRGRARIPAKRDYQAEVALLSGKGKFQVVRQHPLNVELKKEGVVAKGNAPAAVAKKPVIVSKSKGGPLDDPLSMMAGAGTVAVADDPLSSMAAAATLPAEPAMSHTLAAAIMAADDSKDKGYNFDEWANKRAGILKKYTTNAAIPVVANFMEERLQQENKPVDQAKSRVEQLEAQPKEQVMTDHVVHDPGRHIGFDDASGLGVGTCFCFLTGANDEPKRIRFHHGNQPRQSEACLGGRGARANPQDRHPERQAVG